MIYFVTGLKGGIGKSLFSRALAHYLKTQDRVVMVVDLDADNPDVYNSIKSRYKKVINTNLPGDTVAAQIVEYALEAKDIMDVIVNTPGGAVKESISEISYFLENSIEERVIENDFFRSIFLCISDTESGAYLAEHMRGLGSITKTFVVRNDSFSQHPSWNSLNCLGINPESFCDMPFLGAKSLNALKSEQLEFREIIEGKNLIMKVQLNGWLKRMSKTFEKITGAEIASVTE